MNESASTNPRDVPWRTQIAIYGVGLFTTSVFHVAAVVIPLYAYTMNPSPFVFGLVFGAAHLLPLLFSIHAGALMDRLGARRVLLFCTVAAVLLPLVYPLAPDRPRPRICCLTGHPQSRDARCSRLSIL